MNYICAEIPKWYRVEQTKLKCAVCENTFYDLNPIDPDLIKYIRADFKEERWLPTETRHGYFDLVEKLMGSFDGGRRGLMSGNMERIFKEIFLKKIKPGAGGVIYVPAHGKRCVCVKCGSSKALSLGEIKTVVTPDLLWLEFEDIFS